MFESVKRRIPSFLRALDFIYPRDCADCGAAVQEGAPFHGRAVPSSFCARCWRGIKRLDGPRCPVCAVPFPSEAAVSWSPDHRCGECRKTPPLFSKAVTPFIYEGTLAKAIHLLKYQKQNHLAEPLARLLADDLAPLPVDRVTAVPLHPRRLRAREFNQSLLLAERISRLIRRPLLIDPIARKRETPPQVGLSKKEREKNMKGAFSVTRPRLVENQRILLIDDVYTTGTTLKESAKTLIQAGAQEVIVAALARMI
ncbi:MAG TPA: ComF family protein [Candidatus Manganitrophaceae bacterium]|nr:ComF family protein [Candidatus Manganitrophaceae bacterium]